MTAARAQSPALRQHTAEQRAAMVQLLPRLSEEQWRAPSLCRGWSAGHVAAHLTMPFRVSLARLGGQLLRAKGNFDRAADRIARADLAALGRDGIVDCLAANIDHPWTPPGGGPVGALAHDVIHGLDITEALGLPPLSSPERLAIVVADSAERLRYFGVDLTGQRLEATDTDVAVGQGETHRLPAAQILLVCTGRRSLEDALAHARADGG